MQGQEHTAAVLRDMGYPEADIQLALHRNPGASADTAALWLMERTPEQLEAEQAR